MSALRRTKSGAFTLENAIPFSLLESDPGLEELEKYLIPTQDVLSYPTFTATGKIAEKLLNGQTLPVSEVDGLYKLFINDTFYGVAEIKEGKIKTKTKLC